MRQLLAGMLAFSLTACAWCAPHEAASPTTPSATVEAQIWRVAGGSSTLGHAQICSGAQWEALTRAEHAELLEDQVITTTLGTEAQVHFGQKRPFTYSEPRAQRAQVQYVDLGCKLDISTEALKDGSFELKMLPEMSSSASTTPANLEPTDVLKTATAVTLKPGEVAVVGATRGAWTSRVLSATYPQENLGSDDTMLIVVRLVSAER